MSMTFTAGDPPMSFNFVANGNNNFDNSNNWKFYKVDQPWWGSADSAGNFQPWQPPPQDANIPWFVSDQTFEIQPLTIEVPSIGQLRFNPVTGLIEMYDGTNWMEYGRPINPPPGAEQPPKAADDFELGGAL